VSTASSPSSLKTPHSGGLDAFEFHFEDKSIRGPSGPHLFSGSPHIARDTDSFEEFELYAEMSLKEMTKATAPTVSAKELPHEEVTKARPFSSLNKAVAKLDETQVRDWTPHQVANWMREAGFETSVVDKFVKHDITGAVLLDLQFEDLKELDITSYGKRHRVMNSIQHLRNSSMVSVDITLSRSNSKLERQPQILQRAPNPEEGKILAYQTDNGLKSRSPSSQRRGRRLARDDAITPAESISIVAIEQLLPKPHKCSKGEDCPKWQKQQRKFQKAREEFGLYSKTVEAPESKQAATEPSLQRPKSEAVLSAVASSDVLGLSQMPPMSLTPELLSEVDSRDPQENVRQFLSFQHLNNPSPPPSLPLNSSQNPAVSASKPAPLAEHLRSLPKLTIPLEDQSQARQQVTSVRTPISALRQPNQMHTQLVAQLQKDPYHYGDVASPADIYRVLTPYSATDIPTTYSLDPLSRDVYQSVPPDMRYGLHLTTGSPPTITEQIRRPSSTQSGHHPRQPSFTPSVAPVSEFATPTSTSHPKQSPRHHSSSQPLAPETQLPTSLAEVSHAGCMRKRRTTKLLRHEWQDSFFSLKGTQLAMHVSPEDALVSTPSPDSTPKPEHAPAEVIDVGKYAITCSSLASSSKLSAGFKKSILGSNHRTTLNEQAFAFSLILESKKLFASNKSHHFSVKTRDERIEWMRDLMLAKALTRAGKEAGSNGEIRVDENLI
jgi:SAM domain (Sterile alpha motif)